MTYPEGDRFFGEFVAGKKNGKGAYFWENGNIFVGFFIDNDRNG